MLGENKVVNSLWIGSRLSSLEMLTLNSFLSAGHTFHLWVYEELDNDLPEGVLLKDANEIIPVNKVYQRKKTDPTNNLGANSFGSPFSDLFRYKLLYLKGGWWVDMDITCLKPLDDSSPYYFRSHLLIDVMGNIIKCPKGSALMKNAYEETNRLCDENTEDWLLPNRLLGDQVKELGLDQYIHRGESNHDVWFEIEKLIYEGVDIPEHWSFIHWMNEEWRTREMTKNSFINGTTIAKLMDRFHVKYSSKSSMMIKTRWFLSKYVKQWKVNRWYHSINVDTD